jgi:hypothetical protein
MAASAIATPAASPKRARSAGEPGYELPPILDADAVQEHDKPEKAKQRRRCGARHQGAHGETYEQNGPDPKCQAAEADLSQGIA